LKITSNALVYVVCYPFWCVSVFDS